MNRPVEQEASHSTDKSAAVARARSRGPVALPAIHALIAVASGKGGVGKSTVAANLAAAFAARGRRVGLLDADIYGPSIPRMMGIGGTPVSAGRDRIQPLVSHGITCMSIGFVVGEADPVIWRGPLVARTIEQLLTEVDWGPLDVLVIDLPPGTGDAQLTLAQRAPLTGAVIVSTPQDIALSAARKGLHMFQKVGVPVFGLIENMSYFICPHCGARTDIFAHGGAQREAERLGTTFLGEIPLDMRIRETSDGGTPIVIAEPESPQAQAFLAIADRVWPKAA
ncbi:MAG: Mrp/NBP35 family ATP-binding protein [Rhodospirillales bacterium]|jgi:ATP-binding protein involved in chromosome partitioning|nr:Mrp/NBP35 family ATP-binding protein [Rhodospirillales bacterium]